MKKPIDPAIGQRIRARRLELGIGPGETSDKIHVTPGSLNHIETGKRMPSLDLLIRLATLLRCPIDALLRGKKEGKPSVNHDGAIEH